MSVSEANYMYGKRKSPILESKYGVDAVTKVMCFLVLRKPSQVKKETPLLNSHRALVLAIPKVFVQLAREWPRQALLSVLRELPQRQLLPLACIQPMLRTADQKGIQELFGRMIHMRKPEIKAYSRPHYRYLINFLIKDSRLTNVLAANSRLLGQACYDGNTAWVKLILKHPSFKRDAPGVVASFKIACGRGRANSARLLLVGKHVNPVFRDFCPFTSAINSIYIWESRRSRAVKIVGLLLRDGRADPAAGYNTAIRRACHEGYADVVRLLLTDKRVYFKGVRDWGFKALAPINVAAKEGHAEVVKLLADTGRYSAEELCEPLGWAATFGRAAVVRMLLSHKHLDLNLLGIGRAMVGASEQGNSKVLELFLGHKPFNPVPYIPRAVREAVSGGAVKTVRVFLQDGRFDPKDIDQNSVVLSRRFGEGVVKLLREDARFRDRVDIHANAKRGVCSRIFSCCTIL